ncbi:hypothetical protein LTR56_009140 [Elasticomyces elasticus]|nr:hypothetical protein LTR56_009140 [Elasticomyces elasticus]
MAEHIVETMGVNVPAPDLSGPQVAASQSFMDRYAEERDKRLNVGVREYIDPSKSEKYKHFLDDPWIEIGTPINRPVQDNGHIKVLVVGAGFGGLLFAARLMQAGFKVEDILIVDPAGGFGGTWYWNRFPGLMCDTESYIYLPLLEETGYVPSRKYASGSEIRKYLESIATKYGLHPRAQFQSKVRTATWNERTSQWDVTIAEMPKGGKVSHLSITADYVFFASGVLANAKLIEGVDAFDGPSFHTARWDYSITGGSPEDASLTNLKDKRVAYIGTGATAVQAVPHLAKWCKDLFVFQRTPSSIDQRDNRDTDLTKWKSDIATGEGWQRQRSRNFNAFAFNAPEKPSVDLVNDGWTRMLSYSGLIGTPRAISMNNVGEYLGELHQIDYVRSERIRKRCEDVVNDEATAKALQAWYPGWCKRPCFHDEYLPSFNNPHVHLVDTNGRGIDAISASGPVFDGKTFDVDIIIWGTGFVSPHLGSAAGKAAVQVHGRRGISLEARNDAGELATLHGVLSQDFPNMFWPGPGQAGISPNQGFTLDTMTTHIAHIIHFAEQRVGGKAIIEPTAKAVEDWGMRIAQGAIALAGMAGCTPGYLNMEGLIDKIPPEMQMKAARNSIWAGGMESFCDVLGDWRHQGGLEGLNVKAAA